MHKSTGLSQCIHGRWGSWLMLQDHSLSSWKGHGGFGEIPEDWKKASTTLTVRKGGKEDLRNRRLMSLTSISRKMIEQLILESCSRHVKDKKASRSSQYGFMKWKLYVAKLILFQNEMTGCVNEGRALDAVYLNFSKVFDSLSHNSGTKPSGRLVTSGVTQGSMLGKCCLSFSWIT